MSLTIQQVSLGLFPWRCPRSAREDKLQGAGTFQVSSCDIFSNVTLAKARHMAKPRFEEWGNRLHIPCRKKLQNHFAKDGHTGRKEFWALFCNLSQGDRKFENQFENFFFFLNKMPPSTQKKAEKPTFNNQMTFKPPILGPALRTVRTILMKTAPGIVSAGCDG